jgi:hypothetical protein
MELMNELARTDIDLQHAKSDIQSMASNHERELEAVRLEYVDKIETLTYDLGEAEKKVKDMEIQLNATPIKVDIIERKKLAIELFKSIAPHRKTIEDAVQDSLFAAEILLTTVESVVEEE